MGSGIFCTILAVFLLILSGRQFQERGLLLNNAYLWASQKERQEMDAHAERKRPHYRQSGWVFLLLGVAFAVIALYCFLKLPWLPGLFFVLLAVTLIYAVASSVKEFRKS